VWTWWWVNGVELRWWLWVEVMRWWWGVDMPMYWIWRCRGRCRACLVLLDIWSCEGGQLCQRYFILTLSEQNHHLKVNTESIRIWTSIMYISYNIPTKLCSRKLLLVNSLFLCNLSN
jgi:hypothetical protein